MNRLEILRRFKVNRWKSKKKKTSKNILAQNLTFLTSYLLIALRLTVFSFFYFFSTFYVNTDIKFLIKN